MVVDSRDTAPAFHPRSCLVLIAMALSMGAAVAHAQNPSPKIRDIHSFVACLNSIPKENQTVVDSLRCVPPGCKYTVTASEFSAQKACVRDGVELPRVIFSCPGPAPGLRFRPSFSLCPDFVNFTELGEDVDTDNNQRMADILNPTNADVPDFKSITEFTPGPLAEEKFSHTAVVSTTGNNKGCTGCHGAASFTQTGPDGRTVLISRRLFPFSDILDTNDTPDVTPPATPKPLSEICTEIENSTELFNDPNVDWNLLVHLCERLNGKIEG